MPEKNAGPVGAHEHREAAIAVRLIHHHRGPRNLGALLQDRGVPGNTLALSELTGTARRQ